MVLTDLAQPLPSASLSLKPFHGSSRSQRSSHRHSNKSPLAIVKTNLLRPFRSIYEFHAISVKPRI